MRNDVTGPTGLGHWRCVAADLAVAFLCSDQAAYVKAEQVRVGGGASRSA